MGLLFGEDASLEYILAHRRITSTLFTHHLENSVEVSRIRIKPRLSLIIKSIY